MGNKELVQKIIAAVGGAINIQSVWHCATRLRFKLKDKTLVDKKTLEVMSEVVAVVDSGGQLQIVIGNDVNEVYKSLREQYQTSEDEVSNEEVVDAPNHEKMINRIITFISGTFSPFLGALAGTGVLKGILALSLVAGWLTPESGVYKIWYAAGDALFYFLPILLALTAAKQLKVNQYTAMALAGALVYPSLATQLMNPDPLMFFGVPVVGANYASSVLPILLAVWLLSYLEPQFNRILPASIRNILTPMLLLMIMVPLTLLSIGPLGNWIGQVLSAGIMNINQSVPFLAGAIIGACWQLFVIFGVHWTFIPIIANNIGELGHDPLTPIICASVMAQAGAALGVFLRVSDTKLKSIAGSSVLTSLLGITEPTIYGVTLKLKKPFYIAIGAGGLGGAIIALGKVQATAFTLPSLLSLPAYLEGGVIYLVLGLSLAFCISTVGTYFFGVTATVHDQPTQLYDEDIKAPVVGQIVPLMSIDDEVFASGAMGQGIGIIPKQNIITAPVTGEIITVHPHAIGIRSKQGAEILIHVGINTVQLNGKHFKKLVEPGKKVNLGDPVLEFDRQAIQKAGYDPIVLLIVTNTPNYQCQITQDLETTKNWLIRLRPNPKAAK